MSDIDPSTVLSEEEIKSITTALLEYQVHFFRDQDLFIKQQKAFGRASVLFIIRRLSILWKGILMFCSFRQTPTLLRSLDMNATRTPRVSELQHRREHQTLVDHLPADRSAAGN